MIEQCKAQVAGHVAMQNHTKTGDIPNPMRFRFSAAAADARPAQNNLTDFGQWSKAFMVPFRPDQLHLLEDIHGDDRELLRRQQLHADPFLSHSPEQSMPLLSAGSELSLLELTLEQHAAVSAFAELGTETKSRTYLQTRHEVWAESRGVPKAKDKGPLATRVAIALADSGQEHLTHALTLALQDNLKHVMNSTCSRKLTRKLTASLTVSLTDSLVELMLNSITDIYVDTAHRILVHTTLPALTHSVAAVVVKAMSRHPQEDYFCYYCKNKQIYCQNCQNSATNDHWIDYYTAQFAQYYSNYYSRFYSIEVDLKKLMHPSNPYQQPKKDPLKG